MWAWICISSNSSVRHLIGLSGQLHTPDRYNFSKLLNTFYYQLMHITLKNAELLKHSKLDKNVLITLRLLTLCASVGNKKCSVLLMHGVTMKFSKLRLKCDGTRAETRFLLSAKRTSPFKSAGTSVRSTTGSRVVRISGSNAGYTMFRGSVKNTGYPLHSPVFPSLPLLCVTMCHQVSTELYPFWVQCEGERKMSALLGSELIFP